MQTEPKNEISRTSKYYFYLGVLFVAVLLIANTVAVKIVQVGPFSLAGGTLVFPISYIFGDILTEVYGYKATRKIVWSGFVCMILMSIVYWLVELMPSATFWNDQSAYTLILGMVPRIVLGSIIGYFVGEFSNSYVMSKMKIWTNGRHLWTRTVGSTVVGEAVDTVLFSVIAFAGSLPVSALITVMLSGYMLKVAYEVIITPVTYVIVNWLKKEEGIDIYDRGISYNPFASEG